MDIQQDSILVVDDDPEVLAVLAMELEDDNYAVTPVSSAEQALAMLQVREFAAIVSDVKMPGVDGLSLVRQCAVRYPNMVRVILTAFDDDNVNKTAMGPQGAYKLVKPWGSNLRITLENALSQRKSTVELRRHLDFKHELMDIDRRLHPELEPPAIIYQAALEMARIPEVTGAAIYTFSSDNSPHLLHAVRTPQSGTIPILRRFRTGPVPYEKEHIYSVAIGDWSKPAAAIALQLSSTDTDTLQYLDFIGRQAFRTLLIIKARSEPHIPNCSEGPEDIDKSISSSWAAEKLTTPATVLVSAAHGLRRLSESLLHATSLEIVNHTAEEFMELTDDLDMVSSHISVMLQDLKDLNTAIDQAKAYPDPD